MKTTARIHFFIIAFFALNCESARINNAAVGSLPAASLHPYGRFAFDKEQRLELISSAVHFSFTFEGSECRVFASIPNLNGHNYIQYELDGVYQKRVRINGNSSSPIIIRGKASGKFLVTIYKATEAHTGAVFIEKIEGANIKSIPPSSAPAIEFIGNSITCGAAADTSDLPCGKGEYHDYHNAYYAYGPRVARALKANYIVSSVSGIGVYRTWNADGPSMPQVYEKADFKINSPVWWNFKTYRPKIVSIALGTNDLSNGDGKSNRLPFDSARFVSGYIKFVELVKSKYPAARILLLSSPMIGGNRGLLLQHCLEAVKSSTDAAYQHDAPVALFFFQPMQPHGCSGHPSVEDHAVLADQLLPVIKKML